MPELPRFTLERSRAARACARPDHRSVHKPFGKRSRTQDRQAEIYWDTTNDRGRSHSRNPATFAIHGKCWAWLSRAWSFRENLERRRIAAHSTGGATRLELTRRALRFGRTDHRFASARQSAFARHPDRTSR